jgi:hypothetical protein
VQVIIATKITILIKPNQQLKVETPILVVKNVEVELGLENNKINRKVVFFFFFFFVKILPEIKIEIGLGVKL